MRDENYIIAERMLLIMQKLSFLCEKEECRLMEKRGLHLSEGRLLSILLSRESFSMQQLASIQKVTTGRMTKIIDGLVEKKLVERKASHLDRRFFSVSLTLNGKSVAQNLKKSIVEDYIKIIKRLNSKTKDSILEVLEEILTSLEEHMT